MLNDAAAPPSTVRWWKAKQRRACRLPPPTLRRWRNDWKAKERRACRLPPLTLCRWRNDWSAKQRRASRVPPPTLCRWRNDWRAMRLGRDLALSWKSRLHRRGVGGVSHIELAHFPSQSVDTPPTQGWWKYYDSCSRLLELNIDPEIAGILAAGIRRHLQTKCHEILI